MSQVKIQGNASGTGIFTIASPNSNSNRTLDLPDNTGTIVTTGSTAVVTDAMLANGYPNQAYVTPVSPAYQNMGSTAFYNLGSISIPSSGDWRVFTHLRWGFNSLAGYVNIQLSTTTGSGGLIGYPKMQFERVSSAGGNSNLGLTSEFIVRFGTAVSFPYTLYLLAYEQGTGTVFLQNDVNGPNQLGAIKLASTTSTASAPVQIGY